jgi:hypothetical protein
MGAVVPGWDTMFGVADVVATPLLLLPADCGGSRPGGGVPVLPGPQDSIMVGEPHVNGLKMISVTNGFYLGLSRGSTRYNSD